MPDALQILVVERETLIALDLERALLAALLDPAEIRLLMPVESLHEDRRFDLVVCDRDMAVEILDYWRSRAREGGAGALVLTTSLDSDEDVSDAWPVVRKPFRDDELASAVRAALAMAADRKLDAD